MYTAKPNQGMSNIANQLLPSVKNNDFKKISFYFFPFFYHFTYFLDLCHTKTQVVLKFKSLFPWTLVIWQTINLANHDYS